MALARRSGCGLFQPTMISFRSANKRMATNHPSAVMSGQSSRSWNLPGSFNGFFASSRHSETDPEVVIQAF